MKSRQQFSACATLCLPALLGALVGALQCPTSTQAQSQPAAALSGASAVGSVPFSIRVREDLVLVRAVVRDDKGNPVPHLQKDDFEILDRGRSQRISYFSEESAPADALGPVAGGSSAETTAISSVAPAPAFPDRYFAFFFDDVHGSVSDLKQTREAIEKYLSGHLLPGDRVGIFSSSGKVTLDFTADRDALTKVLGALTPQPKFATPPGNCPDVRDLMAYHVVEMQDTAARQMVRQQILACGQTTGTDFALETEANAQALQVLDEAKRETLDTLDALEHLVTHLGGMPGQRSIVLVSPGFFTMAAGDRVERLVDRALRLNVVLNALDAKGLVNDAAFMDASVPSQLLTLLDQSTEYAQLLKETRFEH
jgi:VWFA-related protein